MSVYDYFNIESVFKIFFAAGSKNLFFLSEIKKNFKNYKRTKFFKKVF